MPTSTRSSIGPLEIVEALSTDRARYLSFVRQRVRSAEAAEDVLQLGFTRAFERAGTLRDMDARHGWFFRILRNVITDQGRREATQAKMRRGLALEGEQFSEATERTVSSCLCVGEIKNSLSPAFAQILERVEVEGLPVKTFAADQGLTASAAGVRMHRARKALLDQVQKRCGACASEGCLDCTCQRRDAGCSG